MGVNQDAVGAYLLKRMKNLKRITFDPNEWVESHVSEGCGLLLE